MLNYQRVHVLKHESMTCSWKTTWDFIQEIHALGPWAPGTGLSWGNVTSNLADSPRFTMGHERIKKKMFESKMLLDDRYR